MLMMELFKLFHLMVSKLIWFIVYTNDIKSAHILT